MPVAERPPLEVVSPKSGIVKIARVTISHAQILALNTTPITFGDAPGANRVNLPIFIAFIAKCAAGAYGSNPLINVTMNTASIWNSAVGLSSALNRVSAQSTVLSGVTFSIIENRAFTVTAASNNTAGNAANSLTVIVAYTVGELP